MFCSKCGNKLNITASMNFCPKCGEKISDTMKSASRIPVKKQTGGSNVSSYYNSERRTISDNSVSYDKGRNSYGGSTVAGTKSSTGGIGGWIAVGAIIAFLVFAIVICSNVFTCKRCNATSFGKYYSDLPIDWEAEDGFLCKECATKYFFPFDVEMFKY